MGMLRIALPLLLLIFALGAEKSLDRIQSLASVWQSSLMTLPATLVAKVHVNGEHVFLRNYCYAGDR
ncbi:MAG TPA: hypothetical protein VMU52_03895 [Steroidobacteraceae bacterium]|nr:hypothetical protein [Steroidobacteraceae bacterium]